MGNQYGIPEGTYPAHARTDSNGNVAFHTVYEHCRSVGNRMRELLEPIGLGSTGELVGLYHDEGKHCPEFKEYLLSKSVGDGSVQRRNFHSLGGTNLFYDLETEYREKLKRQNEDAVKKGGNAAEDSPERLTCELIADVIFSHHTRHDFLTLDETKRKPAYKIDERMPEDAERRAVMKKYEEEVGAESTKVLLNQATAEIRKKWGTLSKTVSMGFGVKQEELDGMDKKKAEKLRIETSEKQRTAKAFFLGMLYRTILSALIYADHEDSARFSNPSMPFPKYEKDWHGVAERMRTMYSNSKKTPINAERQKISDICASFGATHASGIYKMNVPTGGGKTMSSLRLVAEAAKESDSKRRTFFIMPLLSIIEQNAGDMKNVVDGFVTAEEFHSNVKREKDEHAEIAYEENEDETEPAKKIATDVNWDAPMIITSLVQFLNATFKGDSANLKRFSSLMNGIIVIDEVQSIPRKMMSLFNLAIDFLAYGCGCLVILCSATQPEFEKMRLPIIYENEDERTRNVIGWDEINHEAFKRVEYVNLGMMSEDEIAEKVKEITESSLLVICNKKDTVRILYNLLKSWCDENGISIYCISADLCKAHRNDVMKRIREDFGRKIVISTQVMEAGVDMSFANVLRIAAGADNLAQAAGRCNRNGEYPEPRKAYCVELRGEKLGRLRDIEDSKNAFCHAATNCDEFMSNEMISAYYERRDSSKRNPKNKFDFPLFPGADEDDTILEMLSENRKNWKSEEGNEEFKTRHKIKQSFRTAWSMFDVFDGGTTSAIVRYGKGAELISDLRSEKARHDVGYMKTCLKNAQDFSITTYTNETEELIKKGVLIPICEGTILTVAPEHYDDCFGFTRKTETS